MEKNRMNSKHKRIARILSFIVALAMVVSVVAYAAILIIGSR